VKHRVVEKIDWRCRLASVGIFPVGFMQKYQYARISIN
jgi:hypothetical protein